MLLLNNMYNNGKITRKSEKCKKKADIYFPLMRKFSQIKLD